MCDIVDGKMVPCEDAIRQAEALDAREVEMAVYCEAMEPESVEILELVRRIIALERQVGYLRGVTPV